MGVASISGAVLFGILFGSPALYCQESPSEAAAGWRAQAERLTPTCKKAGNSSDACERVAELYKKAALEGDARAEYRFAMMLLKGQGVHQDLQHGVEWCKKAAQEGLPEAEETLGYLYDQGLGLTRDVKAACEWWRRGAEQGNSEAQHPGILL